MPEAVEGDLRWQLQRVSLEPREPLREQVVPLVIIPTTLQRTTLSSVAVGDVVNIETDIIARTIVHHLRGMASSTNLTMDALREAGMA